MTDLDDALTRRDARCVGRELCFRCPAHSPDVHPSAYWNPENRVWHCFSCGAGGGEGDLARRVGVPASAPPGQVRPAKVANPASAVNASARARQLWAEARPAAGTLVERYLASRGLDATPPQSLRFAAELLHLASGRVFPAIIAAVTMIGATDTIAIHRTYLRPDGAGKADVEPCRMALGPIRGGAVQLAAAGARLAIAEGIETALSVQLSTGIATWAALSASNMVNVILPALPLAAEIVIAADADPAGLRAAHAAAVRWSAQGRRVRIAQPPAGLDFNDVLMGGGGR